MFIKFNRDFEMICTREKNSKDPTIKQFNRVFIAGEENQIDRIRWNSNTVDIFFSNGDYAGGLNHKYVLGVYNESQEPKTEFVLSEKVARPSARKSTSTDSAPEQ
jgi:hypothetical protein